MSPASGTRSATGIGQIAFLLVPSSVVCAVLAEPIVRLLYERGEFDPHETHVVAGALAAFSLGLAFNGIMLMLNRAFFSLQSPGMPTGVAGGNLVLNAALFAALYRVGVWGIPLAISLANVAGTLALLWSLRRRLGSLDIAARRTHARARHGAPRRCSRSSPSQFGGRSTMRSAARSPPSSSRSERRSSLGSIAYLAAAVRSGCARWRRYYRCETASAGR